MQIPSSVIGTIGIVVEEALSDLNPASERTRIRNQIVSALTGVFVGRSEDELVIQLTVHNADLSQQTALCIAALSSRRSTGWTCSSTGGVDLLMVKAVLGSLSRMVEKQPPTPWWLMRSVIGNLAEMMSRSFMSQGFIRKTLLDGMAVACIQCNDADYWENKIQFKVLSGFDFEFSNDRAIGLQVMDRLNVMLIDRKLDETLTIGEMGPEERKVNLARMSTDELVRMVVQ